MSRSNHMIRWPAALVAAALCAALSAAMAQDAGPLALPFSAEETTGSATIKVRHKATWDRKSGRVSWKKLEVDVSDRATVRLEPGVYDPRAETAQALRAAIEIKGGKFLAEIEPMKDGAYAAAIDARLEARDAEWIEPAASIKGLAFDAEMKIDSRAEEEPIKLLMAMALRSLSAESVAAGIYRAGNVSIAGDWARPDWRLERASAETFGGAIEASGFGTWGTSEAPSVSIDLRARGIDLRELLTAFNVPRAAEIEGRIGGSLVLSAQGREWNAMAFDLAAEPGSVRLSRDLVHAMLGSVYGVGLEREEVEKLLDAQLGKAPLVAFDKAEMNAVLESGMLRAQIPLENRALKLDYEARIEEAVLWDIWDELMEAGAENIRGASLGGAKKGP